MKVLITGANSYVGEHVAMWLNKYGYHVDIVDTIGDMWKQTDFSQYDTIFHVAGIAHVNAKKSMKDLYYKVNCDLAYEVASKAKEAKVSQFIFMSSMIVYQESQSLKPIVITKDTIPAPNGFYGDSKLQAEKKLQTLATPSFKICILRPPMIYGPNCKGNFPRLISLAQKTPVFPKLENQRSMLYIDNLCEFVKKAIEYQLNGIFFPQNAELTNTVNIVRFFANHYKHKIWFTTMIHPLLFLFSPILQPINKLFATYYYDPKLSTYDFNYCVVSLEESLTVLINK